MAILNIAKKVDEVYSSAEVAREALDAAGAFMIPVVDGAAMVAGDPRETFAEQIFDEQAAEQPHHYAAEGVRAARESKVMAASVKPTADAASVVVEQTQQLYVAAVATLIALRAIFISHRMRPPGAKHAYQVRTAGLWLGDVVGVATAAIWLGEIPALAVLMAISAATATVTAGLVGKELKWIRERLRRACDESALTEAQKPYAHLFRGADKGERIAFRMVVAAGFVGGLVACSICALRAAVDSLMAGVTFGALAGAVAIASVISSYFYADEICDLLDNTQADVDRFAAQLKAEAASTALSQYAESDARAESISTEFDELGQAAVHTVGMAKNTMLAANPGVVGHGRAEPVVAPVGRLHVKGVD